MAKALLLNKTERSATVKVFLIILLINLKGFRAQFAEAQTKYRVKIPIGVMFAKIVLSVRR